MAYYAALVSVVELLKDITHHHRYPNFLLDKHQLHFSLYAKFNHLLEMFDDYSPEVPEEESNDILERRIRDAAYGAQDIIESHISTTLLPHIQLEKRTGGVERVRRHFASTFGKALEKFEEKKYYRHLGKVKREVDSIIEELIRIKGESNITHEDMQPTPYTVSQASNVQAPTGRNTMVVFDNHLMTAIKGQLCGESSKLEVISIVGMGGLGKTTLARNIFDDRLIYDHFDCRAWVTVSQDYHLKTILLNIGNSLNIKKEELDRHAEEVLYKHLFGRRYLIIMDDVWEAKFWDDIKKIFPDNLNGSRLIITTRLSNVANYANSSKFHHQMQFLDDGQSWALLREKIFAAQEHCPEELEVIGMKIAKNCRGLPLAIVVIAGILSNVKRAQYDWENIARKVSSIAIDEKDEHLLTILSLSYKHLPHHLKPCFLYFGGYPEDYEICISKLIRLWVAEGFLKPIESKSLEEVGEEYLKDLVNRNLVLITRKKSNGKFKFCIIHDILRELCSQRARDENFLLCVQRENDFQGVPTRNVHRVYIQTLDEYSKILKYINKQGSNVLSLIYCSPEFCFEDGSLSAASSCKLLRILDTKDRIGSTGSGKILKLLHLRYLSMNEFAIPVPSFIFHLQNLQTVTMVEYSCAQLPSEIWKMPQLRHVITERGGIIILPPIPYDENRIIDGVPLLGSLQTLSKVKNPRFSSDTIEMIPNLKKLGLICDDREHQVWEDYGLKNLVHLHQLETLYIKFEYWSRPQFAMPLPENFAFPSTLTKLTLYRCHLHWKDMSAVGSLPNLQVLKLRHDACLGEKWEPIEGEFLKLKFLLMESLYDLKYWRAENIHFPILEQLHILLCNALEGIPPEIGDIPTLQLIYLKRVINDHPGLKSSALEILQQQRDLGNDDLQVLFPRY